MITANNLTKRFRKDGRPAVDNVSFTAKPGEVTGFLGLNGAGKSTTMRMIVGLEEPTEGSASINGSRYDTLNDPSRVAGSLLDPTWPDQKITVNDYLAERDAEWMGRVYNFLGLSVDVVKSNSTAEQRKKVILIGIIAALVLRIFFALIVTWLMGIVGLIFAGGLLLLWVSWKFWRELRADSHANAGSEEIEGDERSGLAPARSFAAAAWAVAVADVSMSLDNVLAVAGAAKDHPYILIVGLAISVVLMGVAATLIANLLDRHRWIAWIGLLVILYVALNMIWQGTQDVASTVPGAYAYLFLPLGYLALPGVFPIWMWVAATLAQVAIYTLVATLIVSAVRSIQDAAAPPTVAVGNGEHAGQRLHAPPGHG